MLNRIMQVLNEQEEIEEKIAKQVPVKQVPVIARKSTREKPQKRKRTGFLGLFGKKEEAFVPFQHTCNPFFMFLLQFKLPVTVSHQLFADLHRREGRHWLRPVLLHATERHREWKAGYKYTYNVTITLYGLQVSVDTGSMTWGDGEDGSGSVDLPI